MSTTAVSSARRFARFYDSTIGKKAIMAVTGFVLVGYLILHMLGNLQVYMGAEVLNRYAETLHRNQALLWSVRTLLLVSVVLHIWSSIQLAIQTRAARPVGYVKTRSVQSTAASRTMMWTGPVIGAFIVYHLLHLTTGTLHTQFVELRAYENVVNGFRNPIVSVTYIAAMLLVGAHLSHGIWSMFQSVGFSHPRYSPHIKRVATIFSWMLAAGFISVPVAVLFGVVGN